MTFSKRMTPWQWTKGENDVFEHLKQLVTLELILKHMNPQRAYRMETDASNYVYGAVLSQKQDEDNRRHPVAFMSKSMMSAERNYDIGDKEMLAIVKPLEHWQHWLEGLKLLIEICTDHKNLVNFSNPQILKQQQM